MLLSTLLYISSLIWSLTQTPSFSIFPTHLHSNLMRFVSALQFLTLRHTHIHYDALLSFSILSHFCHYHSLHLLCDTLTLSFLHTHITTLLSLLRFISVSLVHFFFSLSLHLLPSTATKHSFTYPIEFLFFLCLIHPHKVESP